MTKKLIIFVILVLTAIPAFAETIVDTAWVRRYDGPGNSFDDAYAITVDDSGNVYVTGGSHGIGTDFDYATIKYYSSGDTGWVRRYNGPGNIEDDAYAISEDDSGNVYVTGGSYGSGTSLDYATIKYNHNGDTVWVRRYTELVDSIDGALAIAVDGSGNVYVTGQSYASGTIYDFATIKYDSNGDVAWVRRYNGPGNNNDWATALALDGSNNVYVTGQSTGSGTERDYATIKYYPNGDTAWVRRYNGPENGRDGASCLSVDSSGNIYVTGRSYASGTYYDYATIKYNPDGGTVWEKRYNGPGNDIDAATVLAVDGSDNVYVTGYSIGSGTSYDYATIKYFPNGDTAWVRRYNGPGNGEDYASDIAVDDVGNVYVTGESDGGETGTDFTTIKYFSNGDIAWVMRYNGPGNSNDCASAMAVNNNNNLYVTGYTYASVIDLDYATIKYFQALRGDVNRDGLIDVGDVVFLINYLFRYGPSPDPLQTGDTNCIGGVDVGDVVVLINYLFKGGPEPSC